MCDTVLVIFTHLMIYSLDLACVIFFFNDTATTEIYTLSLHDALPILIADHELPDSGNREAVLRFLVREAGQRFEVRGRRSEEHTSELQSPDHLVCRLLLEKKKNIWLRSADIRTLR